MKIEKESSVALNTLSGGKTKFTIDEEGSDFIIEALSKTIYKNPIGTLIREYVSNAFDANQEAGTEDPVIVTLDKDSSGDYLSVIDYGIGLSDDRINNIFCRYGKSTKRGDNNQIGGFGIGAKSAFAYTDTFFINTVHEKVLYKYVLYKTEKVPQIQLLTSEEVDQRNSTQIKIYIKQNDLNSFHKEVRYQLRYFDSVYVQHDTQYTNSVITDFETFKFSSLDADSNVFRNLHICLGKVAYPLNFDLIGLPTVNHPFALKFEIGDLPVTLSREELQYDTKTIEKIKAKIEDFKKELQKIYLDTNQFEFDNLFDREKFELSNPSFSIDSRKFQINSLVKKKFSIYTLQTDFNYPIEISPLFEYKGYVKSNGEISRSYDKVSNNTITNDPKGKNVFLDVYRTAKDKSIFYHQLNGNFRLLNLKKEKYRWYKNTLGLSPKNLGNVKRILQFRAQLIADFQKYGISYSKIEISVDYKKMIALDLKTRKDAVKAKQKRELEEKKSRGEIPVYDINSNNYKNKSFKFSTITIKGKHNRERYIYASLNRLEDMKLFYRNYNELRYFYKFVVIEDKNLIYVQDLKNFIHLDQALVKVKYNFRILTTLQMYYHVHYNKMYNNLTSYYFLQRKDEEKKHFLTKFTNTIFFGKLCTNRSKYKISTIGYDEIFNLSEKLNLTHKDYLSPQDLVEVKLANKIFKMIPLIAHVDFNNAYGVVLTEMKRRGFLPGVSSFQPISQWEHELIKSNQEKINYKRELCLTY